MATNVCIRRDTLLGQAFIVFIDSEENGVYDCYSWDDETFYKSKGQNIRPETKPLAKNAWQLPLILKDLSEMGYADIEILDKVRFKTML